MKVSQRDCSYYLAGESTRREKAMKVEGGCVSYERLKEERICKYKGYKELVRKAIEAGKIFRIITTMDVTKIRLELKQRGYIEAVPYAWNNKNFAMSNRELLDLAEEGNQYEQVLLSKMIDGFLPDYLWVTQPRLYDIHKSVPFINKISISDFVDWGFKDGLHKCMQQVAKTHPDVVQHHYSRSYVMTGGEDLARFHRDFRFTYAVSFLRFITSQPTPKGAFSREYGKVRPKTIHIAIDLINAEIAAKKEEEENRKGMGSRKKKVTFAKEDDLAEARWNQLKRGHIMLLKRNDRINEPKDEAIEDYLFLIKMVLDKVNEVWPERRYDGHHNMWLLKPTYLGEGCGIVITDNECHIHDVVNESRTAKYIVQKYVEHPMLIYNTKFDIRQYFIVQIDESHLKVWSSPVSSVKFASVEYTKRNFHESIHITNTAIQLKYKNRSKNSLPDDHLWGIHHFTNHLDMHVERHLWRTQIYPQMNKVIAGIVQGSSQFIDKTPGRFELFGCDWLLTDDYKPVLLEINRPPSLEYYTPVSALVCGTIMEDLVRVTVDHVRSPYAYTGSFELIHQEELTPSRSSCSTPILKDPYRQREKRLSLLDATPIQFAT